jgi:hypothetical protein
MARFLRRRPSPALVVACIALFVSLSGVSYGVATGFIDSREIKNNTVRSKDIRNNEVRGVDVRNSTVQGRDVALNTLTGADIAESRLGEVPAATKADDAASLGGQPASAYVRSASYVPFSVKLQPGQTTEVASKGTVSITAECAAGVGGNDRVRLLAAVSSTAGAAMGGEDNLTGPPFLVPTTSSDDRVLASVEQTTGQSYVSKTGTQGGFVFAPDGTGLSIPTDSVAFALNYGGTYRCMAAGVAIPVG